MNHSGEYPSGEVRAPVTTIGNSTPVTIGLLISLLGVAVTAGVSYQRINTGEDRDAAQAVEIAGLKTEMAERVRESQRQELRTQRVEDSVVRIERGQDRMERKLDQVIESVGVRVSGGRQR